MQQQASAWISQERFVISPHDREFGGASLIRPQLFQDTNGHEWMGKATSAILDYRTGSPSDRYLAEGLYEIVGNKLYDFFGVPVPDMTLSLNSTARVDEVYRMTNCTHLVGTPVYLTMSKFVTGFKDFEWLENNPLPGRPAGFLAQYKADAQRKIATNDQTPFTIPVNINGVTREVPLQGFGYCFAAALLLEDIDWVGAVGKNIGYVVLESFPGSGQYYAMLVKIDSGEVFVSHGSIAGYVQGAVVDAATSTVRISTATMGAANFIDFNELNPHDKEEFRKSLRRLYSMPIADGIVRIFGNACEFQCMAPEVGQLTSSGMRIIDILNRATRVTNALGQPAPAAVAAQAPVAPVAAVQAPVAPVVPVAAPAVGHGLAPVVNPVPAPAPVVEGRSARQIREELARANIENPLFNYLAESEAGAEEQGGRGPQRTN